MENVKVLIKRVEGTEDLGLPEYKTSQSAGMDILASNEEDIIIKPSETRVISTGLKLDIPDGYEIQVRSRSGLARKSGIAVLNSPGTIDSDFRGEVKVVLINLGHEDFIVSRGDRIAQMVMSKYDRMGLEVSDELSETDRGQGGFGSTGIR